MTAVLPVTRRVMSAQARGAQVIADLTALPEVRRMRPMREWTQHRLYGAVGHLDDSDTAIIDQVMMWAGLFDTAPVIVHPQLAIDGEGNKYVEPGWAVVHLPDLDVTIGGVLRNVRSVSQ